MLRGKRIVVIDDTESIRRFLRISLEAYGAVVQAAATAAGGLALCEESPPDLVVLDIGLPDNEGLNILPRLKRLSMNGRAVPVIVLSVRKDQAVIERARELGADMYLTKPCFVEDVIEVITDLLSVNRAPRRRVAPPPPPPELPGGTQDILLVKNA